MLHHEPFIHSIQGLGIPGADPATGNPWPAHRRRFWHRLGGDHASVGDLGGWPGMGVDAPTSLTHQQARGRCRPTSVVAVGWAASRDGGAIVLTSPRSRGAQLVHASTVAGSTPKPLGAHPGPVRCPSLDGAAPGRATCPPRCRRRSARPIPPPCGNLLRLPSGIPPNTHAQEVLAWVLQPETCP